LGPPSVITSGFKNTFMAESSDMTMTKRMVGVSSGMVTWRRLCHGPAPSTVAAS